MALKKLLSLLPLLKKLAVAKTKKQVRSLLEKNSALCNCICEISLNTLRSRIPLSRAQRAHLRKHKNLLRSLSKKSASQKRKKNLIYQKGTGFLPALLIPALSFLGELAAKKLLH